MNPLMLASKNIRDYGEPLKALEVPFFFRCPSNHVANWNVSLCDTSCMNMIGRRNLGANYPQGLTTVGIPDDLKASHPAGMLTCTLAGYGYKFNNGILTSNIDPYTLESENSYKLVARILVTKNAYNRIMGEVEYERGLVDLKDGNTIIYIRGFKESHPEIYNLASKSFITPSQLKGLTNLKQAFNTPETSSSKVISITFENSNIEYKASWLGQNSLNQPRGIGIEYPSYNNFGWLKTILDMSERDWVQNIDIEKLKGFTGLSSILEINNPSIGVGVCSWYLDSLAWIRHNSILTISSIPGNPFTKLTAFNLTDIETSYFTGRLPGPFSYYLNYQDSGWGALTHRSALNTRLSLIKDSFLNFDDIKNFRVGVYWNQEGLYKWDATTLAIACGVIMVHPKTVVITKQNDTIFLNLIAN